MLLANFFFYWPSVQTGPLTAEQLARLESTMQVARFSTKFWQLGCTLMSSKKVPVLKKLSGLCFSLRIPWKKDKNPEMSLSKLLRLLHRQAQNKIKKELYVCFEKTLSCLANISFNIITCSITCLHTTQWCKQHVPSTKMPPWWHSDLLFRKNV